MAKFRIFVALEMPRAVGQQVAEVANQLSHLGKQVRWVRPEGVHLTLKFLGDVAEERVNGIVAAVNQVALHVPPLTLATAGLGGFPSLEKARVLWLGLSGDIEPLQQVHHQVAEALFGLGFEAERRRFFAHVTVGRARRAPLRVDAARAGISTPVHFKADRVVVMQSELRPEGAVYTALGYGVLEGVQTKR